MISHIINIIVVFLVSFILTGIFIPKILRIAFRKQLFDKPNARKVHNNNIPRLGGLAFVPVIVFTYAFVYGIMLLADCTSAVSDFEMDSTELVFSLCAIFFMYLVGIIDDLVGVRYRAKFTVQILSGVLLVGAGLTLGNIHGLFGLSELPLWAGGLLTVFVVVFITNAINMIDGIDGLASGLCTVALTFYGMIFLYYGYYAYSLVAFSTLGVVIPFFFYNVWGKIEKCHKTFMGDTGSLTLGLLLSMFFIKTCTITPHCGNYSIDPVITAATPLLIPCMDVIRVFLHRVRTHKNPFYPDRNHIHHQLIKAGLSPHYTMLTIILSAIVCGAVNLLLSVYINTTLLLIIDLALYFAINHFLNLTIAQRNKKAAGNQ